METRAKRPKKKIKKKENKNLQARNLLGPALRSAVTRVSEIHHHMINKINMYSMYKYEKVEEIVTKLVFKVRTNQIQRSLTHIWKIFSLNKAEGGFLVWYYCMYVHTYVHILRKEVCS